MTRIGLFLLWRRRVRISDDGWLVLTVVAAVNYIALGTTMTYRYQMFCNALIIQKSMRWRTSALSGSAWYYADIKLKAGG